MENAYLRNTNAIDNLYASVRCSTYCAHNGRCSASTVGCVLRSSITITWVNGYRESGIAGFVAAMDILEQWASAQAGRNVPANEQINFVFAGGAMLCYFGARYICKVAPETTV